MPKMRHTFRPDLQHTTARKLNRALWFVALLAMAVRLAVLATVWMLAKDHGPRFHEPDTRGYLALAEALLQHGSFELAGNPEIVRTPGYPLWLAPGVASGFPTAWAIAGQILLAGWTTWVVGRLAWGLSGDRTVAIWAGVFYAIEPLSALYALKLLTETAFAALITTLAWVLIEYAVRPRWRLCILAGATVAAAMFVRPIAYYLPLAIAFWLAGLIWIRPGSRRRMLGQLALFLLVAMTPAVGWQLRNAQLTGYRGFAAIVEVNLYDAAEWMRHPDQLPPSQAQLAADYRQELAGRFAAGHPSPSDAELYRAAGAYARQALWDAPTAHLTMRLSGLVSTFLDNGTNAWLGMIDRIPADSPRAGDPNAAPSHWSRVRRALVDKPGMVATYAGLEWVLLLYAAASVVGLFVLRRAPPPQLACIAVIGGYLLLAAAGPANGHRFRLPVVPLQCIFAGAGGVAVWRKLRPSHPSTGENPTSLATAAGQA